MAFEEQLPEWQNEGTQPPQSKRVEGWLPNEKPPASWFNWLFHRAYKALEELQQKAGERADVEQAQQTANEARQTANEAKATADAAQSDLSAHASATTGVHGATSTPTPNTIIQRDPSGRAKVAAPVESDDIARKAEVDAHIAALVSDPGGVHGLRVETGTFTPVLAGVETSGNNTYSVQTGRYVKVGRVVHFFVQLVLASKDPNMSGGIVISGLPFTVDGASAATIAIYRFVNRTTDHQLGGRIEGPARISLWENGVNVGPKALEPPQITNTSEFTVSGVYLTNQ